MTRSEHYADSDAETVRESRRRVRKALERHPVGRDSALSGAALAGHVPLKPTTVRDIIAELRDDPTGTPIGQCSSGYYVITDKAELKEWVESVKNEIATKEERLQANVQSFNRREYGGPVE
jgi:hypothetical protein